MSTIVQDLLRRLPGRRPPGRHHLDHPRPGQRPAVDFYAERPNDDDPDDPAAEDDPEDVLAEPLAALHRTPTADAKPASVFARDTWPYNLGSV